MRLAGIECIEYLRLNKELAAESVHPSPFEFELIALAGSAGLPLSQVKWRRVDLKPISLYFPRRSPAFYFL